MKAIRLHQPLGVDGLVYEDAPDPVPAIGDALVEVHACGFTASELDWPTWTDRAGHDRGAIVPAHEFAGIVVAIGYGTAGVAVGDEVYGLIDGYRDGAAAELIAIEARDLAPNRQRSTSYRPPLSPRPASPRGRRCSTTAASPPVRP